MNINLNHYSSVIQLSQDSPLSDINEDRYERIGLANDIAKSIMNLTETNHDCINFAIYGKWGEGKTSLMNFIESILKDNKNLNLKIVHFNPWMAGNEENLIKDFFRSISQDCKEELGFFLQKYGRAISFGANRVLEAYASLNLVPLNTFAKVLCFAEEIKNIFTKDNVPLFKKKADLCAKIRKKNIHFLVFIDDIDRLDKNEVHAVFRLIREVADFPNAIYVTAMDPEVVAKSLSEFYGNSVHEGRSFIEKIIQVPIYLPKISHKTLRKEVESLLLPTLTNRGEKQDEIEEAISLISELLSTPRQLIRFKNQIRFKINALLGEINLCDLCLLEMVNAVSPETYNKIYGNRKKLLRKYDELNFLIDREKESESVKARFEEALDVIVQEIPEHQKNACKEIINTLFPSQTYPGYSILADKRIQSPIFFFRYFYQAVPEDELSEKEIIEFEECIDSNSDIGIISKIDKIIKAYDCDSLNRAIQVILYKTKEDTIKVERIQKFCLSFCQSKICDTTTEEFAKDGLFTTGLILNILNLYMPSTLKDGNIDYHTKETSSLLKQIYEKSDSNFGTALFRLVNGHLNFYSYLEPNHITPLVEAFIKLSYSEQYQLPASEIKGLFEGWRKYDDAGPRNYLKKAIKSDSFDCVRLLNMYIKGDLDAVSNSQSIIEMTYVFGTSLGPLIERLKSMNLEGSEQKALNYLSINWRGFLPS